MEEFSSEKEELEEVVDVELRSSATLEEDDVVPERGAGRWAAAPALAPTTRDFGTLARGSWAALMGQQLEAMAPSGIPASPSDIVVGTSFVLMNEVLTLCMPIQFMLPAGTRCRVLHLDSEGDVWAGVPSAVHLCSGRGLCFDIAHACEFQMLLHTSSCP